MADSTKAWDRAFTSGSKDMQKRLMKVHAKNPAFQSWLKSTGYAGGESVKQASKEVMQSDRSKKLAKKSLAAYGATRGTRMGSEDGSGESLRDTIAPLTRDQHSKVQIAKREAEKAGRLDTKEKRLQFLKKLAIKPAAAAAPAEDFDEVGHEDHMDVHRQLHVGGIGSKYSMDEEVKDSADEGEYDYEGDMAKSQLRSIMFNAKRMHDMLEDNTNLPEWVQSKITLAEDYISTAANYMQGEMNEEVEQIDELVRSTVPGSRDVMVQISKETDLDKANKLVRDALAKQQQITADREAAAAEVKARAATQRALDKARLATRAPAAAAAPNQSMTTFAKKLGSKLLMQRLKLLKPAINVLGLGGALAASQKIGRVDVSTEVDGKPDVTAQADAIADPKVAAIAAAAAVASTAPRIARGVQTARQDDVATRTSAQTKAKTQTKVDTTTKEPGQPRKGRRFPPIFGTPSSRELGRIGRYHVGGKKFRTPVTTSGPYSYGYSPRSFEVGYEPGMTEETQINEGARAGYGRLPSILRAKRAKAKAQGKPLAEEGRVPTTPEHEKFAALAPPYDKVSHADKIAGALRNKKNKLIKSKDK